jgi:hypothetical protein
MAGVRRRLRWPGMRRRRPGAGTTRGGGRPARGLRARRRRLCLGTGGAGSGVGRPTARAARGEGPTPRAAGGRRGRKDGGADGAGGTGGRTAARTAQAAREDESVAPRMDAEAPASSTPSRELRRRQDASARGRRRRARVGDDGERAWATSDAGSERAPGRRLVPLLLRPFILLSPPPLSSTSRISSPTGLYPSSPPLSLSPPLSDPHRCSSMFVQVLIYLCIEGV